MSVRKAGKAAGKTVKPVKVKPLNYVALKRRIKNASSIQELARLYESVKLFAALANKFDFKIDYDFYEAYVDGKIKRCRSIATERLLGASKAKNEVLSAKAISRAVVA